LAGAWSRTRTRGVEILRDSRTWRLTNLETPRRTAGSDTGQTQPSCRVAHGMESTDSMDDLPPLEEESYSESEGEKEEQGDDFDVDNPLLIEAME
jgi:hypothetical protein